MWNQLLVAVFACVIVCVEARPKSPGGDSGIGSNHSGASKNKASKLRDIERLCKKLEDKTKSSASSRRQRDPLLLAACESLKALEIIKIDDIIDQLGIDTAASESPNSQDNDDKEDAGLFTTDDADKVSGSDSDVSKDDDHASSPDDAGEGTDGVSAGTQDNVVQPPPEEVNEVTDGSRGDGDASPPSEDNTGEVTDNDHDAAEDDGSLSPPPGEDSGQVIGGEGNATSGDALHPLTEEHAGEGVESDSDGTEEGGASKASSSLDELSEVAEGDSDASSPPEDNTGEVTDDDHDAAKDDGSPPAPPPPEGAGQVTDDNDAFNVDVIHSPTEEHGAQVEEGNGGASLSSSDDFSEVAEGDTDAAKDSDTPPSTEDDASHVTEDVDTTEVDSASHPSEEEDDSASTDVDTNPSKKQISETSDKCEGGNCPPPPCEGDDCPNLSDDRDSNIVISENEDDESLKKILKNLFGICHELKLLPSVSRKRQDDDIMAEITTELEGACDLLDTLIFNIKATERHA